MLGSYTQLFWALILQYWFFGETMNFLSAMGATAIMSSTLWVIWAKETEQKMAETHALPMQSRA